MRHALFISIFALLMSFVPSLSAEEGFETVLLPTVAYDVPGAHGSLWSTHLWVYNGSDRLVSFDDDIVGVVIECVGICVQPSPLEPDTAALVAPHDSLGGQSLSARLIGVRSDIADDVTLTLRVQDLSRASTTWGTSVPVVRESDLRVDPLRFFPVPFSENFRVSLRIYAPFAASCEAFTVRSFDLSSGATTGELTISMAGGSGCVSDGLSPAYAALHSLDDVLPQQNSGAVGIEVIPTDESSPYWAMLTVTSDTMQHVTVILPE